MLHLIGIGLTPHQLTLEALHTIQACSEVFLENYTSAYAEGDIHALEKIIARKIVLLPRRGVEDESRVLMEKAKNEAIALLVFGNPLTATTHISLLEACAKERVNYRVIPGISIFNYRGMSGLDEYRFGRTTTFVFPQEGYEPLSTFDTIVQNQKMGLHTHCLFDLHPEQKRFMTIQEAVTFLEYAASARETNIARWVGIGMSGMGGNAQHVRAGKLVELKKEKWETFPQSLIICGDLTLYEKDALRALSGFSW